MAVVVAGFTSFEGCMRAIRCASRICRAAAERVMAMERMLAHETRTGPLSPTMSTTHSHGTTTSSSPLAPSGELTSAAIARTCMAGIAAMTNDKAMVITLRHGYAANVWLTMNQERCE